MSNMKKKHIVCIMMMLVLDQLTKYLVTANMKLFESIPLIPNFFHLTYVQNTGGAWSMLDGGNMMFFYLITLVALVVMGYFYRSPDCGPISQWGLVFMIGGTFGNFVDRIRLQYVVDFFDFNLFGYDFPVFNVADCFLCFGVFLLILAMVLERGNENEA